jgi:hypothetical protein
MKAKGKPQAKSRNNPIFKVAQGRASKVKCKAQEVTTKLKAAST